MSDEPLISQKSTIGDERSGEPALETRIGRLFARQPYGVLCTQGQGQPYGSLVALAASEDLATVVFATPKATRKYRLLCDSDHVAIVIDSRSDSSEDMMGIEAVTATGCAVELSPGADHERQAARLVARHPQLASFVKAPTTALFRVDIIRYFHVTRFQEVRQWKPARG